MIKKLTFIVFLISSTFLFGQEYNLLLKGQVFNTESKNLLLMQNQGQQNITLATIPLDDKGFFEQTIKLANKDYYILGLEDNQSVNLIYMGEDSIKVYADGKNIFFHSNFIGSEASTSLSEFARMNAQYQAKLDSANRHLQANRQDQKKIQQEFQPVFQEFTNQRQAFINQNTNSPALIGVLSSINIENDWKLYEQTINSLKKSFGESPTVKRMVQEFSANEERMRASNPLASGNEAKEISLPNPDGEVMKLSDYRGKVVLLDFWASWCGPCRRENPNVVRLYEKYKDKGFEVFSVSLDRTKDAWVQAIEKDQLAWDGHVSDLKFWQSEAAKDYGVSSIPTTVLIDRDGKIIQANLRGPALEQALQELFD